MESRRGPNEDEHAIVSRTERGNSMPAMAHAHANILTLLTLFGFLLLVYKAITRSGPSLRGVPVELVPEN